MGFSFWLLPLVVTGAYGQSKVENEYLLAGDKAYMMAPPDMAVRAWVRKAAWSSDGKYLLVERLNAPANLATIEALARAQPQSAPGKVETIVYGLASGKATVVTSVPSAEAIATNNAWLAGSAKCLITTTAMVNGAQSWTVSQYDAATGRSKVVLQGVDDEPNLTYSSTRPEAVAIYLKGGHLAGRGIFADGTAGPEMDLPSGSILYDGDGAPLAADYTDRRPVYRVLNLRAGALGERRDKLSPAPPTSAAFAVGQVPVKLTSNLGEASAQGVLLARIPGREKDVAALTVTTDGVNPQLSPALDTVCYLHHGTLMVRRLLELPRAAIEDALAGAKRLEAMNNSKQAALAAIMFASDMDETLPSPEGVQDKLYPYIRNRNILDRFVYTFAGGPMSGIAKPAETEIGYTPGPGGRAVAYADGHVKWIPDS